MKTHDGLGQPIDDAAAYYIQDARSMVGNCILWWAPNGQGYECDLRKAGKYLGKELRGDRATDVPWPCAYVEDKVVHHVRGDVQAFQRLDQPVTTYRPMRGRVRKGL